VFSSVTVTHSGQILHERVQRSTAEGLDEQGKHPSLLAHPTSEPKRPAYERDVEGGDDDAMGG
jgi:hypothetical protein